MDFVQWTKDYFKSLGIGIDRQQRWLFTSHNIIQRWLAVGSLRVLRANVDLALA